MFKEDGYVHIKGFLDDNNCQELTTVLKQLVAEKKTVKDEQCPLSPAVKDTVVFDTLLQDVLPQVENYVGKKSS